MKKIIFACLALAFLVQSCSNGRMFSKKHYGHLNWIDHDTKVETGGTDKPAANKIEKNKIQDAVSPTVNPVQNTIIEQNNVVIPEGKQEKEEAITEVNMGSSAQQSLPQTGKTDNVQNEEPVSTTVTTNETENVKHVAETIKADVKKPMMDEDVKLILCVILAFFIAPLAMYLWDSNTDTWFIIDLIFYLCWFLWIVGPYGLLGIASIVIALLRIFGAL